MEFYFRILVWEDGFCDFFECERAGSGYIKGRFGADIFFKMSHEVYNFGEGWELIILCFVFPTFLNETKKPSWKIRIDNVCVLLGSRLVGKVAADNSHKWVFKEATTESEPGFTSSWNASIDPVRKSGQLFCWMDACTKCNPFLSILTLIMILFHTWHSNRRLGNFNLIQEFRSVFLHDLFSEV